MDSFKNLMLFTFEVGMVIGEMLVSFLWMFLKTIIGMTFLMTRMY